jgi:putative ABC transport system substrate-binding protein
MKRREFVTLMGATVIAWPVVGTAQQPRVTIGFLHSASAANFPAQLAVFRAGLKSGGYIEGENLVIEYRWAEGNFDRLPALARELVDLKVAAIAAMGGGYSNLAAKAATTTIPIVFNTGADPVKMGLVSSLNRPGGNITGISFLPKS